MIDQPVKKTDYSVSFTTINVYSIVIVIDCI